MFFSPFYIFIKFFIDIEQGVEKRYERRQYKAKLTRKGGVYIYK